MLTFSKKLIASYFDFLQTHKKKIETAFNASTGVIIIDVNQNIFVSKQQELSGDLGTMKLAKILPTELIELLLKFTKCMNL